MPEYWPCLGRYCCERGSWVGHFGSTGEKRSFSLLPFTKSIFATDLTRGVERRGAGENGLAYRTVADAQLLAVLAVLSRPASLHSSSVDQYKTAELTTAAIES
jgi:hypothetical protein